MEKGKFHGSAQNSTTRGKLWAVTVGVIAPHNGTCQIASKFVEQFKQGA